MSTINISDLYPTGSELFSDSENYMNELVDNELEIIYGGIESGRVCDFGRTVGKASMAAGRVVGRVVAGRAFRIAEASLVVSGIINDIF